MFGDIHTFGIYSEFEMALPKKLSRAISVDGSDYRWATSVTLNKSASAATNFALTLIVETTGNTNCRIYDRAVFPEVLDPAWEGWYGNFQDNLLIMPRHVATVVESAIASGWNPILNVPHESNLIYAIIADEMKEELAVQKAKRGENVG